MITKDYNRFKDVLFFESEVHNDDRGYFCESLSNKDLEDFGLKFKQQNLSVSKRNVFRGMHIQVSPAMGKLVRCVSGKAIDFFLDLRRTSDKRGCLSYVTLDKPNVAIYIPPGFAHGFLSLEDNTTIEYLCTESYDKTYDFTLNIQDKRPELYTNYKLSERDRLAPSWKGFVFED